MADTPGAGSTALRDPFDNLDQARREWLDSLSGELAPPARDPSRGGADPTPPISDRDDGAPGGQGWTASHRAQRSVRATVVVGIVASLAFAVASFGRAASPVQFGFEGVRDLAWECPVATPYNFVDTFGAPRSGERTHAGVDVFGEKGSPISSIVSGEVAKAVKIDDGTLGGARVWVEGDDGWWYYYAHLDSVTVEKGDRVDTGEQLGTMGNTGNAATTPTHVHLEQHFGAIDAAFVNPYVMISSLCGEGS